MAARACLAGCIAPGVRLLRVPSLREHYHRRDPFAIVRAQGNGESGANRGPSRPVVGV